MASKLRRAPLFGPDNPLGIPVLPKYTSATSNSTSGLKRYQNKGPSNQNKGPSNQNKGPSILNVPKPKIPTALIPPKSRVVPPPNLKRMELGVASYVQQQQHNSKPVVSRPSLAAVNSSFGNNNRSNSATPRTNLHVEFAQVGEMKEKKEKYLTAKYGAHQMSLIRKRLSVEMWMYDQLQILYKTSKDGKSDEKEIDLDELMDIDEDLNRKKFLQKLLMDCKQSHETIESFISDLLERAKTL